MAFIQMVETFEILLIEDDPVENKAISSILDDGFVHLVKYSVNSELEKSELPDRHYDVAIIDIDTLSEKRPFYGKILNQLKHHNPDCLMIILSSDMSQESIKPLMEIAVRKIVSKPCGARDILHPIHQRIEVNFQDFQQKVYYEHLVIDKKVEEIQEFLTSKPIKESAHQIFSQKLKQLSALIAAHFLLEERHMTLYRYPDLYLHQDKHNSLLDDIKMLLDFDGNHDGVVDEHLEAVDRIHIKLDHDQHFMEFVSHLSHINNVYAT